MDINTLRIAVTLLSLVLFLGLMLYTWSRRRAPEYEAAALLPFADEPGSPAAAGTDNDRGVKS